MSKHIQNTLKSNETIVEFGSDRLERLLELDEFDDWTHERARDIVTRARESLFGNKIPRISVRTMRLFDECVRSELIKSYALDERDVAPSSIAMRFVYEDEALDVFGWVFRDADLRL